MENKSKEMAEEMNQTIEKLNVEASALEVEKEKKAVSSPLGESCVLYMLSNTTFLAL